MNFSIEEVTSLDGKDMAILSDYEKDVFDYFRSQGIKFGVRIQLSGSAPKDVLKVAESCPQYDEQVARKSNQCAH